MQATINIGGKDRMVWMDMGIAYDYEVTTGRALHGDINDIVSGGSLVKVVDLLYTALTVPIREKGGIVDFRPRDVAAWIAKEPTAAEKFAKLLNDAFAIPAEDAGEVDAGKKKKAAVIGNG
jgi:hypothetical protein